MNITAIATAPLDTDADAIVIGCFASDALLSGLEKIDAALSGAISRSSEFTGKANQAVTFATPSGLKAATIVLIGLGPESDWCAQAAAQAAGTAAHTLAKKQLAKVAFFFPGLHTDHAIAAAINGCTGQDLYRSKKSLFPFQEILWSDAAPDQIQRGSILARMAYGIKASDNLIASALLVRGRASMLLWAV